MMLSLFAVFQSYRRRQGGSWYLVREAQISGWGFPPSWQREPADLDAGEELLAEEHYPEAPK